MYAPLRKSSPAAKMVDSLLIDLPAPTNLSTWWNMGSMLGVCLVAQIVTGLFLMMHYNSDISGAYESIVHITDNVGGGWWMRSIHANGASVFFMLIYAHMARAMYYGLYTAWKVWLSGLLLYWLAMITAFVGYILPWGQMSYWAATVITSLLTNIPYLGTDIAQWVWGGYAVGGATLSRFSVLHYIFPLILIPIIAFHIGYLHVKGSGNPLGVSSVSDKITFHPYYSAKDLVGFIAMFVLISFISMYLPTFLLDVENSIRANEVVTPTHIQPEWYFSYVYTILRSFPTTVSGILMMVASLLILCFVPLFHASKMQSTSHYPLGQILFWVFIANILVMTWAAGYPVETPYSQMGLLTTLLYFSYFVLSSAGAPSWDTLILPQSS
uniref:Cytochrome b n=1 Tax=Spathoderma clenchi TaxID=1638910 RepID=A0A343YNC6_9MOLL|nr:cytochrome b [Spathoderma clenchi]